MIIIWGTRSREVEVGSGSFTCPRCQAQREYVRKRVGTYFTLFFIPLFRIKDHGEFVECAICHQKYELSVLDRRLGALPKAGPIVSEMDRLRTMILRDLEGGMPLQMAQQKLINKGIHVDSAEHAVTTVAGVGVRTCPACGLWYANSIERCTSCGAMLELRGD